MNELTDRRLTQPPMRSWPGILNLMTLVWNGVEPGFTGCGKTHFSGRNDLVGGLQVVDFTYNHLSTRPILGPQKEFFRSLFSPANAALKGGSTSGGAEPGFSPANAALKGGSTSPGVGKHD